jgi:hypothetical protein
MNFAPSTSTNPSSTSHHGKTRLIGTREAMDPDSGAFRRLTPTVNQNDSSSDSNKTEDPIQSATGSSAQALNSTLPTVAISAPDDQNELKFDQPFLAAHTGKLSPAV